MVEPKFKIGDIVKIDDKEGIWKIIILADINTWFPIYIVNRLDSFNNTHEVWEDEIILVSNLDIYLRQKEKTKC